MVIPRSFSSFALSIWSNGVKGLSSGYLSCSTRVIAAVRVVLPWSMWPMVPMFTCGLVRSNLAFATGILLRASTRYLRRPALLFPHRWTTLRAGGSLAAGLLHDLLRHVARNLGVAVELHGVVRPALGLAAQIAHVAEHLRKRDQRPHDAH